MSKWQHVRTSHGSECADCWDEHIEDVCLMPDPDPDSPCGYLIVRSRTLPVVCERPAESEIHRHWKGEPYHPHVPTRCTCGHSIEAER